MSKPSQNQTRNKRCEKRSLKSRQFKGTRMRKWGKWVSEIRMPKSTARIWLGSYDSQQKAARAYDFALCCLRGAKAKLNFPLYPPEIPCASCLSPPQIQAAAARYAEEEFPLVLSLSPPHIPAVVARNAAEEFRLLSEDVAFASSRIEAESDQVTSAFWDFVLEDMDSGGLLNCPPLDVLFQLTENWGYEGF